MLKRVLLVYIPKKKHVLDVFVGGLGSVTIYICICCLVKLWNLKFLQDTSITAKNNEGDRI